MSSGERADAMYFIRYSSCDEVLFSSLRVCPPPRGVATIKGKLAAMEMMRCFATYEYDAAAFPKTHADGPISDESTCRDDCRASLCTFGNHFSKCEAPEADSSFVLGRAGSTSDFDTNSDQILWCSGDLTQCFRVTGIARVTSSTLHVSLE